ncbi:hypothetical protein F511_46655 [Dorcoceras hygrometricum]|uniref:Uncharacterized protein n=1 Tax=Dorcoceras hygrometricum TaxID=472368 RepID=A0A2Z7A0B6_9LAMI|nr:hypothetical protein F511_46655 [Dorcoceras hygrometricum]
MRAGRAWWLGAALHDAQALRRKLAVLVDASSMAGRTIAHMLAHVSIDGRASAPRDCAAGVAPPRATMGEAVRCEAPLLAGDGAHSLRVLHAAHCARLRAASRAAAAFSWWRRHRRRPPLRRRSGDAPASFRRCRDGWSEFL